MGTVLDFAQAPRSVRRSSKPVTDRYADGGSQDMGVIIIFPGIRIERQGLALDLGARIGRNLDTSPFKGSERDPGVLF